MRTTPAGILSLTLVWICVCDPCLGASHMERQSPLLCSTNGQPIIYYVPNDNPCDVGNLETVGVSITYNRPIHTTIKGWRIRIMEVTCTTHYFFWGSYTHSFAMTRSKSVTFPDMSQGATCPDNTWKYTNDHDMERLFCPYSWPGSTTAVGDVYFVERATLMLFEGVTTVDGHPVQDCTGNLCPLTQSEVFYHSFNRPLGDSETVVHYRGPALCNSAICMIPHLRETYPILEISTRDDRMWTQYKSIAGTLLHREDTLNASMKVNETIPIADAGVIAKITNLEVETQALKEEVENLCHSLKNLYMFIKSLTSLSPTAAARMYLNRTDLYAIHSNGYLMVWPCVAVDTWVPQQITGCTAYVPILYETYKGNKTGYLNQVDNIVYEKSPVSKCQVHHIMIAGKLTVIHQYTTSQSRIEELGTTALNSSSLYPKITYNASGWASSPTALHETRPREFSYEDLTEPRPGAGRPWIEEEIETRYPILPYLVHTKSVTLVLGLIVAACLMGGILCVLRLRARIALLEGAVRDYAVLRRL